MAFERVEAASPQAPIWREPALQLDEPARAQLVHAPLAVGPAAHESSLAQHAQVARGVGLAQPARAHELADGVRPVDQQIEDRAARRLGHDVEHARHAIKNNLLIIYLPYMRATRERARTRRPAARKRPASTL